MRRDVVLTHKGRTAIEAGVRSLDLGSGGVVLMPSYNCGSEVDAVLAAGCQVRMYRVLADTSIDLVDLEARISADVKAVYVTHYFGWPQPLEPVKALCRSRSVALIEDCALALYSADGDTPIGQTGDLAVFSMMKTLPIPDGGAMICHARSANCRDVMRACHSASVNRECLRMMKRYAFRRAAQIAPGLLSRGVRSTQGDRGAHAGGREPMPDAYGFEVARFRARAVSRVARGLMRGVKPEQVVARRRHNYEVLAGLIKGITGVRSLFSDLPAGVCPLVFPVVTSAREGIASALARKGIHAIRWWSGFHTMFDWSGFEDAVLLKDSVLAFHVHQQLDTADIEYLGREIAIAAQAHVPVGPRLVRDVGMCGAKRAEPACS